MSEENEAIRVRWETIDGSKYSGVVVEIDCNVLIVKCDDGKKRAVEAEGCELDD